ncbi:TPA: hypothetical protein UL242_002468 [Clostridioides difficile]|uniref:hypothetical protein n=1 Tax=Clostridioides difficile TaxID=1496 RepID=UPI000BB1AA3E|nr:hypothetical protein [Clostridioides difficile]EGT3642404.1 hypothetical protein [Clostridioides difficile]MBH7167668.1 hypothetical protein [Clostridioides difficile]MBH7846528.1 hypothetical protein [Clostridioides difficile]MBY1346178.1 hypothetical protein [Clostridioides difficile]MBY1660736.1 hypothetical protein [Clostridioides difficile]
MNKIQKEKVNKYKSILKRLDNAEIYYIQLDDSKFKDVENSKAYIALCKLIREAGELYIELSEENISVPRWS